MAGSRLAPASHLSDRTMGGRVKPGHDMSIRIRLGRGGLRL